MFQLDSTAPEETEKISQPKQKSIPIEYEEEIISDEDDDFPDGEEMLKTVGVIDLKKSLATPVSFRKRKKFFLDDENFI